MTNTPGRTQSDYKGRQQGSTSASPSRSNPRSKPVSNRFGDEDIEAANVQLGLAFQLAGLVSEGHMVCPACAATKKKVQAKTNPSGKPYWKCQKCKAYGSATKLLMTYRGYSFPDAVNTLLGRPTSGAARKVAPVAMPEIVIAPSFKMTVDIEVYDAIRNSGSLEGAQAYYAAIAHIDPKFVAEAGSTYISNARSLQQKLTKHFGSERLRNAGVVTLDKNDKDFFLFSDDYCVIEVHERACRDLLSDWDEHIAKVLKAKEAKETPPEAPFKPPPCKRSADDNHGHVVGMQFRPSLAQKRKIDAHKAWKKRWSGFKDLDTGAPIEPSQAWETMHAEAPETAGPKVPYVTPFLSLRGATPQSLVGCGLRRLSELPEGSIVYVVEGFKDLLAARTMGAEAYAIPGTGVMPQEHVCKLLRKHILVISLDGDAAGAAGTKMIMEHFASMGIDSSIKPNIREGMDVADILIERKALEGCTCDTCTRWRADHPS